MCRAIAILIMALSKDSKGEPSWFNDYLEQLKFRSVSYANNEEREVKLKELCAKIKKELENQGRESFIIFSDDECRKANLNEDMDNLLDSRRDYVAYSDILDFSRLASIDCGDFIREIWLEGVFIEDDELKFYLQEFRETDDDGASPCESAFSVNVEELLNGWWTRWNLNDYSAFCPEPTLYMYLILITEVLPKL